MLKGSICHLMLMKKLTLRKIPCKYILGFVLFACNVKPILEYRPFKILNAISEEFYNVYCSMVEMVSLHYESKISNIMDLFFLSSLYSDCNWSVCLFLVDVAGF